MLINWICHTKSETDLFLYTRNLKTNVKNQFLSTKSPLNLVLVLWIHKGYYVLKRLVWNVRIKAFCYKIFVNLFYKDLIWVLMLVLLGMLNAFSLFKHLIIQTENLYHLQHAFVVVISQLSTCAFSLFKHLIIQTMNLYHLQHTFVVVISQLSI